MSEPAIQPRPASQREVDELVNTLRAHEKSITKLTKLVDAVTERLDKRLTELETTVTYHEETPHVSNIEV